MTARHLLEVDDLTPSELMDVLDRADRPAPSDLLAGRGVALLFDKSSARTRNATEMAVVQLGGHPLSMRGDEVGIDRREPAEDLMRVLERYHAVVAARVHDHGQLERMAAVASVPVVNLLSDLAHPLQALADLLTLRHRFGRLDGLELAFIGDANNVFSSLALAASMVGITVRLAAPEGYRPTAELHSRIALQGGTVAVLDDPVAAAAGAHAVYTDVWVSMGQDDEAATRRAAFASFTIDDDVMAAARPEAVFLHCLPAHRGEEVTASVMDGPASVVFDQAEQRMHSARGALWWLVDQSRAAG